MITRFTYAVERRGTVPMMTSFIYAMIRDARRMGERRESNSLLVHRSS